MNVDDRINWLLAEREALTETLTTTEPEPLIQFGNVWLRMSTIHAIEFHAGGAWLYTQAGERVNVVVDEGAADDLRAWLENQHDD